MSILIKKATIVDPSSPAHRQVKDLWVKGKTIRAMDDELEPEAGAEVIEWNNCHVSPGWMDIRAHFCDPGFENREDLTTGSRTAAAGGLTQVGLLPVTAPPLSTKTQVQYIRSRAAGLPVEILPYATIAKPESKQEITEMLDLHHAGTHAFTNGDFPIEDAGLLKRAMLYTRAFDGLLMLHPQYADLKENGEMNEGHVNVMLGLNGDPAIAEHTAIARDIEIARYTEGRIHFAGITTSRSIALVEQAKNEGLSVSADVSIHHLLFSEADLMAYGTNLKFSPPLRSAEDQEALKAGLKNGIIDTVTADHRPVLGENKQCEFPLAKRGAIGVQLILPLLQKAFDEATFNNHIVPRLTQAPRSLLGLRQPTLQADEQADLTLFNPGKKWVFDRKTNCSRSRNSPFYGSELTGQVLGTINKGTLHQSPVS